MGKTQIAIVGVIVVCIFAFGIFLGKLIPAFSPSTPRIFNTATVLRQIQTLSQLVTVKYVMEKVVVVEDKEWYGENRLILIAHGIVKAGIDLEKLQPGDLKISEKKISLTLPPAIITDAYLNDRQTQVLERTTGLMRTFDKDLEQNGRRLAVSEMISAARKQDIEKEASERAKVQLTNLFHQLGFEQVEIKGN